MRNVKFKQIAILGFLCLFMAFPVCSQENTSDEELLSKSLEELMNMDVNSVSNKVEKLMDVDASKDVLTSDEIVKTRATELHKELSKVPE